MLPTMTPWDFLWQKHEIFVPPLKTSLWLKMVRDSCFSSIIWCAHINDQLRHCAYFNLNSRTWVYMHVVATCMLFMWCLRSVCHQLGYAEILWAPEIDIGHWDMVWQGLLHLRSLSNLSEVGAFPGLSLGVFGYSKLIFLHVCFLSSFRYDI